MLSVLSNGTNLILGFSSPLKNKSPGHALRAEVAILRCPENGDIALGRNVLVKSGSD